MAGGDGDDGTGQSSQSSWSTCSRRGIPLHVKQGPAVDVLIALTFAPLPLEPDVRCEFRLTIASLAADRWTVASKTVAAPPSFGQAA